MAGIEFNDGLYTGDVWHGKPHGFGEYTYKDGRVLRGRFEKGKFIG